MKENETASQKKTNKKNTIQKTISQKADEATEWFKEKTLLELDLLFSITYMAAISTSDISRAQIFEFASERKEYVISKYIRKVFLLAKNLNYEYSRACKVVSEKLNDGISKDFFGRFSNAISSGEPEKVFLKEELETTMTKYKNKYEKDIEVLKKWMDGYSALLVSTTLIVLIEMISLVIYNMENINSLVKATSVMVIIVCFLGVYLLYRSAPSDVKTHSLEDRSKEQEKIRTLEKVLLPIAFITVIILNYYNTGIALIVFSLIIAPIGILGLIDDRNIDKRDNNFAPFIKTLGSVAGVTGTTISACIGKLEKESVGVLEPLIKKLKTRMDIGIDGDICWRKFAGESGSELISRLTKIFHDSVKLGANPAEVGKLVSFSGLSINLLRIKRDTTTASFVGLMIPMHIAMTGLLLFVAGILTKFSEMMKENMQSMAADIGDIQSGLGTFNVIGSGNVDFANSFAVTTVVVITITNVLAIKFATGGHRYKLCTYGALLCFLSGVEILVVPRIAGVIFSGI